VSVGCIAGLSVLERGAATGKVPRLGRRNLYYTPE
jgi:hypothetical protein